MDMWNWLIGCHKEGSLTLEELERVMQDDDAAEELWKDWSRDSRNFIDHVRDKVGAFIYYIQKLKKDV